MVGLLKHPWWIKIRTESPSCLYYYGPFESEKEAQTSQLGYIEDLLREGAKDVRPIIEKAWPEHLTVCEIDTML